MSKKKIDLIDYIMSGYVAYGVKLGEHGQPNSLPFGRVPGDWTDGCIAFSNEEIEELWRIVPDGTTIEIRP